MSANRLTSLAGECSLCPRKCGVDRLAGRRGYCRAGSDVEVFRYGLHHGEEPPVSGRQGSGTVFFSRCTLRCLYCQNHPWSQEGEGRVYTRDGLVEVFTRLARSGAHNWNLVSPTPWLPWVFDAIDRAAEEVGRLPVVYNTSGYEDLEVLGELQGKVSVYLTDLRYARQESAKAGSDCSGYVDVARRALVAMWRQTGPLRVDEEGVGQQGTICRLLVLPGMADEAIANLEWMAETIGADLPVSVMAQYTPAYRALAKEPWCRRPTPEEYGRVVEVVEKLGFESGWVQEYETTTPDELVGFKMSPV